MRVGLVCTVLAFGCRPGAARVEPEPSAAAQSGAPAGGRADPEQNRAGVLAELRRTYGETVEVDEWIPASSGETLVVFTHAAPEAGPHAGHETLPDDECRFARARWIGDGRMIEYELTVEFDDPMTDAHERTCMEDAAGALEDVFGIGEPLFVVRHGLRRFVRRDADEYSHVDELLVVDPVDGHEILALDLAAWTSGGTFSSGTKSRLERAADDTLELWQLDYDGAEEESCRGMGGEDCEPKYVLAERFAWDADARRLMRSDR